MHCHLAVLLIRGLAFLCHVSGLFLITEPCRADEKTVLVAGVQVIQRVRVVKRDDTLK